TPPSPLFPYTTLFRSRDLWWIFALSSVAVAGLTAWVVLERAAWLAVLIVAGYVLGLAYTAPPVSTSYRPFAGEWVGGFPGVVLRSEEHTSELQSPCNI